MKKIIIFILMIIGIFFLSGCAGLTIYNGCVESDETKELMCFTVKEKGTFETLAVGVYPTLPKVGENFKISLGLEISGKGYPITTAKVHFQEAWGIQKTISSWNIINSIPSNCQYGCSVVLTLNAKAPLQAGQYQIYVYIADSQNNVVYKELKKFEVGAIDCPTPSCNEWQFMSSVTNGKQYNRQCYSYSSPPQCYQTVNWEYKTECNIGYVCSGMDSQICNRLTYCVSPVRCGNGNCEAGENCGNCPQDCPCPSGTVCKDGSCVGICDSETCNQKDTRYCRDERTLVIEDFSCVNEQCVSDRTTEPCIYKCIVDHCESAPACGNGICDAGETPTTCPADCKEKCPTCPSPTEWSACINGKQTRTNYKCNIETNYKCVLSTEEKSCVICAKEGESCNAIKCCKDLICEDNVCIKEEGIPWWVYGIIIVGMIGILFFIFRKKKK